MGAYTVGIAYEQADFANGTDLKQISIGGTATFGAATAKAIISSLMMAPRLPISTHCRLITK